MNLYQVWDRQQRDHKPPDTEKDASWAVIDEKATDCDGDDNDNGE